MTSNKVTYVDEIEGSDVPHVDAGTYLAKCVGIEESTTKFGDAFKTHWELPEADDFELVQMTSTATTSGSNFGRIIRALLGRTLAPGEKLQTRLLVGKYAVLEIEINPDSGWNRVREVTPAPQPKASAPQGSAQAMVDRLAAQRAAVTLDELSEAGF
jgi:hypothetical protein